MKLHDLYLKLDAGQKQTLAEAVGISEGYLWQLATHWNKKRPSLALIYKFADADKRLKANDLLAEFNEATEAR
jgi:hypothetical protein